MEDFSSIKSDKGIYLSIDIDFFSPDLVPSVMDPVEDDGQNILENFTDKLNSIQSNIVVCDLVEWKGARSSKEKEAVKSIFESIQAKIENVTN